MKKKSVVILLLFTLVVLVSSSKFVISQPCGTGGYSCGGIDRCGYGFNGPNFDSCYYFDPNCVNTDLDTSQTRCEEAAADCFNPIEWLQSGVTGQAHGEYPGTGVFGCCGDDQNEVVAINGLVRKCCFQTQSVDLSGNCYWDDQGFQRIEIHPSQATRKESHRVYFNLVGYKYDGTIVDLTSQFDGFYINGRLTILGSNSIDLHDPNFQPDGNIPGSFYVNAFRLTIPYTGTVRAVYPNYGADDNGNWMYPLFSDSAFNGHDLFDPTVISHVSVEPLVSSISTGSNINFRLLEHYSDVGPCNFRYCELTSGITYSSNNPAVVEIDNNGLATAKSTGIAKITGTNTVTGMTDTADVTVTPSQCVPDTSLGLTFWSRNNDPSGTGQFPAIGAEIRENEIVYMIQKKTPGSTCSSSDIIDFEIWKSTCASRTDISIDSSGVPTCNDGIGGTLESRYTESVPFSGDSAIGTWATSHEIDNLGNNAEYYFVAHLRFSSISGLSEGPLEVLPIGCGDLVLDSPTEICEIDGSNQGCPPNYVCNSCTSCVLEESGKRTIISNSPCADDGDNDQFGTYVQTTTVYYDDGTPPQSTSESKTCLLTSKLKVPFFGFLNFILVISSLIVFYIVRNYERKNS